jgi:hypothetical protein
VALPFEIFLVTLKLLKGRIQNPLLPLWYKWPRTNQQIYADYSLAWWNKFLVEKWPGGHMTLLPPPHNLGSKSFLPEVFFFFFFPF